MDEKPDQERALVWIDSTGARILRWRGRVVVDAIASDVPPHTRGTAHVRHDPRDRHGGSGRGQDDAERRRNEHLRAFLRQVADRLAGDRRVEILGTGTVGERLARLLRQRATMHGTQVIEVARCRSPTASSPPASARAGWSRRRRSHRRGTAGEPNLQGDPVDPVLGAPGARFEVSSRFHRGLRGFRGTAERLQ